jgi:hypothetical protein
MGAIGTDAVSYERGIPVVLRPACHTCEVCSAGFPRCVAAREGGGWGVGGRERERRVRERDR